MKIIKCIVFDFGGTLAKHPPSPNLPSVITLLQRYYGFCANDTFIKAISDSYDKAREQYKLTGSQNSWSHILQTAAENVSLFLPSLSEFENFLWQSYPDGEITEKVKQLLRDLSNKGYSLMLACNTRRPPEQRRKTLKKAGISELFYAEIISSELGFGKPNPDFYDVVIHNIYKQGYKPNHALFIGDSLERDVLGPMKFGMQGLLVGCTIKRNIRAVSELTNLYNILMESDLE